MHGWVILGGGRKEYGEMIELDEYDTYLGCGRKENGNGQSPTPAS